MSAGPRPSRADCIISDPEGSVEAVRSTYGAGLAEQVARLAARGEWAQAVQAVQTATTFLAPAICREEPAAVYGGIGTEPAAGCRSSRERDGLPCRFHRAGTEQASRLLSLRWEDSRPGVSGNCGVPSVPRTLAARCSQPMAPPREAPYGPSCPTRSSRSFSFATEQVRSSESGPLSSDRISSWVTDTPTTSW